MIDLSDTLPLGVEPARYDLDEIVRRLRETTEDWVPRYFPNGRRVGDEWRLANIHGDRPRKQGSCVIALKGPHAGEWIDFDGNTGGGVLSTLEHGTGLTTGRELIEHAAELARCAPVNGQAAPATQTPKAKAEQTRREIDFILSGCRPTAGTPAEAYLTARGLKVPGTPDLLFHPDLTYWETRTGHPAMVALVREAAGEVRALHRTYLAPDGSAKADVAKPRMMLGPVSGGAVRLAPIADNGVLGLAEGIETALSGMQACPALPVWAALSAGNLEQAALPAGVKRIVILADNDGGGAGLRAAEGAAARVHAEGRRVWIAVPPNEGEDFNDLLRRAGVETVKQTIEAAVEWVPEQASAAPSSEGPSDGNTDDPAIGFRAPAGPLPRLRADDGDLARISDQCWTTLRAANTPPWLFRWAGRPVWIERDEEKRPIPKPMTEDRMRHALARLATWVKRSPKTGDLVAAHPPLTAVKDVLARPDQEVPALAGIVTTPVFAPNGTLLSAPGYDPATGLLYQPPAGFELPVIPERPSQAEVAAARSLLCDELLGDFPFTGEAERAHAVALLLLPFVRSLVGGPTPLHMIEKPTPGTGAGLMIDVISTVAIGTRATIMVEGRDDEEWRKRITAKLRTVPIILVLDNLRHALDSPSVAAALTAPYWEDRVLGQSEMTRIPVRCVWIATGNNPRVSHEIARRTVRIRLDARMDQPWTREGFRHSNLMEWMHENRPRLIGACLTLVRAWLTAGRPRHRKTIGSFESWAQTMGGVLEVAGVPGFLANLDEMYEAADTEGATWRTLVALWWERHGTAEVGTTDLHELALTCEPPPPLGDGGDRSQRTRLGKALGRLRDRVFAVGDLKLRITAVGVRHQAQRWRLTLENEGLDERSHRSPAHGAEGNVAKRSHQRSPEKFEHDQSVGERWERGERFPAPYAYAGARARAYREAPDSRSHRSPRSPLPEESSTCTWERCGERGDTRSHGLDTPPTPEIGHEGLTFDAIFDAYGLDPWDEDDRQTATGIWMGMPPRSPPEDPP